MIGTLKLLDGWPPPVTVWMRVGCTGLSPSPMELDARDYHHHQWSWMHGTITITNGVGCTGLSPSPMELDARDYHHYQWSWMHGTITITNGVVCTGLSHQWSWVHGTITITNGVGCTGLLPSPMELDTRDYHHHQWSWMHGTITITSEFSIANSMNFLSLQKPLHGNIGLHLR